MILVDSGSQERRSGVGPFGHLRFNVPNGFMLGIHRVQSASESPAPTRGLPYADTPITAAMLALQAPGKHWFEATVMMADLSALI